MAGAGKEKVQAEFRKQCDVLKRNHVDMVVGEVTRGSSASQENYMI